MKALVLAGGFPQIDLLCKLKSRGFTTILADYTLNPIAKNYADKHYCASTLNVEEIRSIAIKENVDVILTVCTDQALLTVAQLSEELNLPCYIDYETAKNVTNKEYMKEVFAERGIPSAKYTVIKSEEDFDSTKWKFPLIVKPVDCNSSKGVRRVNDADGLKSAVINAVSFSRSSKAIVEEYIIGKELSVDVYVENGKAKLLDISTSEKLKIQDQFIIFRSWHPANISRIIRSKVITIIQQIADAFRIKNSPMLVQMIADSNKVYVIEFSARTGGGVKHLSIKHQTGIDVISLVIDLTLKKEPHITVTKRPYKYTVDEYIYCLPGVFERLDGFEPLKKNGTILDYYVFKSSNTLLETAKSSGDRIGGFTVEGNTYDELLEKHQIVNGSVKVLSSSGEDMMRHDFLEEFNMLES